jgi:hypothetical protein
MADPYADDATIPHPTTGLSADERAELHDRVRKVGLLDALTTEPLAVLPYVLNRIADAKAARDLWSRPPLDLRARLVVFWIDSFLDTLDGIKCRAELEAADRAAHNSPT